MFRVGTRCIQQASMGNFVALAPCARDLIMLQSAALQTIVRHDCLFSITYPDFSQALFDRNRSPCQVKSRILNFAYPDFEIDASGGAGICGIFHSQRLQEDPVQTAADGDKTLPAGSVSGAAMPNSL